MGKLIELKLTRSASGQILLEYEGESEDISAMIVESMVADKNLTTVILAAIPSFLDAKKLDRGRYCEMIMQAQGLK